MPVGIYQHHLHQGFQKGNKIRLGMYHSEKTKKIMSKAKKGNTNSKRNIVWNKNLTKETDERVLRIAQNKSGENHPRWIKDRKLLTRHLRNDPEYKQWSKKVKDRDNWKCKINNKDCSGKIIAHHILSWSDYPELRYNIDNGITLCQAHHPRKRAEEKRLIPFLQGLVPVSNV